MDDFFSKDPAKALVEIKEKLYIRYIRTRDLVQMYDLAADTDDLTLQELGYRQGIKEEMRYLEKLIDMIERS